ncbi:hypothetical protein D3C71_1501500 [compost metagenome]
MRPAVHCAQSRAGCGRIHQGHGGRRGDGLSVHFHRAAARLGPAAAAGDPEPVLAAWRVCHHDAALCAGGRGLSGGVHDPGGGGQPHALRLCTVPQWRGGLDPGDMFHAAGLQDRAAAQSGARRHALAPAHPRRGAGHLAQRAARCSGLAMAPATPHRATWRLAQDAAAGDGSRHRPGADQPASGAGNPAPATLAAPGAPGRRMAAPGGAHAAPSAPAGR